MPTILRLNALRLVIYPADHRLAHVHVRGQGGEAVFILNCPDGPRTLREAYGFALKMCGAFETDLAPHVVALCKEWSAIHGDF